MKTTQQCHSNQPEGWPSKEEAIPFTWIDKIFNNLAMMFGHQFKNQWQGYDPIEVRLFWAKELRNFDKDEIATGYAAIKTLDYPPSLPQFLKLCRPPLNPVDAYNEALRGLKARANKEDFEWSHPAVYWTAVSMSYDLKNFPYNQVKSRWESELKDQLAKPSHPEIPAASQQDEHENEEINEEAASRVKEMTSAIIDRAKKRDPKDWARKILAKEEAGEDVAPICVQFAKEALGLAEKL